MSFRSLYCYIFSISLSFWLQTDPATSTCDSVYTIGDDEVCIVSLSTFDETCVTIIHSDYTIGASNGLSINPLTNEIYAVVSKGSKNGDRQLITYNANTGTIENVGDAFPSSTKLSAIAYSCSGDLYGITGTQSSHNLYFVDANATLEFVHDLDYSTRGVGLAYDPLDGNLYRVAGNSSRLDIEQISIGLDGNASVSKDIYVNGIDGNVRAIGYYFNNTLFIIDESEMLYELDVVTGNLMYITNLTTTRKHKGIVCTDFSEAFCNYTAMGMDTTLAVEGDDGFRIEIFGLFFMMFNVLVVYANF